MTGFYLERCDTARQKIGGVPQEAAHELLVIAHPENRVRERKREKRENCEAYDGQNQHARIDIGAQLPRGDLAFNHTFHHWGEPRGKFAQEHCAHRPVGSQYLAHYEAGHPRIGGPRASDALQNLSQLSWRLGRRALGRWRWGRADRVERHARGLQHSLEHLAIESRLAAEVIADHGEVHARRRPDLPTRYPAIAVAGKEVPGRI